MAHGALYNSSELSNALDWQKDTRQAVIKEIEDWATADDVEPVLWLNGPAGSGKSSIAKRIAEILHDLAIARERRRAMRDRGAGIAEDRQVLLGPPADPGMRVEEQRVAEDGPRAEQAEKGVSHFIQILVMISVALGLMNLLPFPALDGGRLMFLGYELITRRRWLDER